MSLRGLRPRPLHRFYDAVFFALGARRMHESESAVAYGIKDPMIWFVVRGRRPPPATGTWPSRRVARPPWTPPTPPAWAMGHDDGAPGQRPQYGRRYYAGYLLDPDGCGWRSSRASSSGTGPRMAR